ncbi:MAG: hypothetical protein E7487_11215 [Ruminococcaceae bacterium]|nr:hypothetical protein [Oscillospiraceae bacterium]
MRDTIYTIPLTDVFEPKDGCPLCRLYDILEERCVEYIMGAAMMEPDVRVETNRLGFCRHHYDMMLARKNRLSIALILESHLDRIADEVLTEKGTAPQKKKSSTAVEASCSCYVCQKIDSVMENMISNLLNVWGRDPGFRQLFAEQPYLCFPHTAQLLEAAPSELGKKILPEFRNVSLKLSREWLAMLKTDVTTFCRSFDYRNASSPAELGRCRDSVERSIHFLSPR